LCIENAEFEKENINLQWTDVPEGTGKMCEMLRDGSTDVAIILTEGIIKDIVNGNPSKIIQVYVKSPLIWGIHVAAKSKFQTLSDLENKKAAISRIGSGSQLMTYVNAKNQGWNTTKLQFEIVNTIDGAVTALTDGTSDYFMWEHFMTKPLVDNGVFRRLDDCPTPWPCFVIAVREEVLAKQPESISRLLKVINTKTRNFKDIPNISALLATTFNQKIEDIIAWLSITEWSQEKIDAVLLDHIQNQLVEFNIINSKSDSIIWESI
jgi:ABC-type nitrate/sulfonate/bicarbonate transport system substrate-binding protein